MTAIRRSAAASVWRVLVGPPLRARDVSREQITPVEGLSALSLDAHRAAINALGAALPPGDYRDDAALTTMANNALALNITVPDGVEATARNGNFRLTGTVSYGSQRAAAELAVAGLTGVRNIKDEIEIVWDADPVDATIAVRDALDRYALIPDDSDVVVDTSANTVTLSGHVRTWPASSRRL